MTGVGEFYPGLTRVVYAESQIASRVAGLGKEIGRHYPPGEEIFVIALLKGAFVFVSDLVRRIERPRVTVDFLMAALYGEGRDPGAEVRLLYDTEARMEGRHVLLVEDVVDSGKTLNRIGDLITSRSPASVEVCALLHKRSAAGLRYEPRWVGFEAPREWLVGYGLDLGERYRHLPFIGAVSPEADSHDHDDDPK